MVRPRTSRTPRSDWRGSADRSLHRLEGFYRVAIAGGYTRAARSFPYPISQPGVYQQVRRLEEDLGVRLFERSGRDRVELTAAGKNLYEFCAPFFDALPHLAERLSSKTYGGNLRIDASALEIRYVLPSWHRRLRAARPDIVVDLEEVASADLTRIDKGPARAIIAREARRLPTSRRSGR